MADEVYITAASSNEDTLGKYYWPGAGSRCLCTSGCTIPTLKDFAAFYANSAKHDRVDICNMTGVNATFVVDGVTYTKPFGATSGADAISDLICTINGAVFKRAMKRSPNYKEYNEMVFNFVKPVYSPVNNQWVEITNKDYIGSGCNVIPTILLNHWGTWYYSYLIDFCSMQEVRGMVSLSDSITRGQLAIMLAQVFAGYQSSGMASLAVRALNETLIPFKGREHNGEIDLALDKSLTRSEFWVMIRRVLESINNDYTDLDNTEWEYNVTGSIFYLEDHSVRIFNKELNHRLLDIASACAILARIKGYIEWSEKEYI
jgi:hypothetical protein